MNPVFSSLSNEGTLVSSGTGVALDWVPSCANEVIKFGKFDNQCIPVILVERTFFEVILDEGGFQSNLGLFL